MNPMSWVKVTGYTILGLLTLLGKQRTVEYEPTLEEIINYLVENPGKMYILPSKKAVLLYRPDTDSLVLIKGDFEGSAEWCNFELGRQFHDMQEKL